MDGVLAVIVSLLAKNEHLLLHFPNPFTHKVVSSGAEEPAAATEGDEAVRVLSNLQWEVSNAQWSALALLGKLLGAVPVARGRYEWAFRDTDDMYYCYGAKDAVTLTNAYFARVPTVELMDENDAHDVNLHLMTDTNSRSKIKSQMFFQPVPTQYVLESRLPHVPSAALAEQQVRACPVKAELRRALRAMSFGSTPVAALAKMVFLHLVCHDTPQNTEETKAALRNLVATQSAAVLEHLSTTLVKRDATWAVILHEAGIGEAMQGLWPHAPLESLPRTAGTRKRGRGDERGEPPGRHRPSPIVESLSRAAGSAPPTPALLPQTTADVELFLKTASFAELFRLLEDLDTVDRGTCEKVVHTACALPAGSEAHRTWCTALVAYLLRELQKLSIHGSTLHLLDTVQSDRSVRAVFVCRDAEAAASGGAAPSLLFCKNKHPLRVHFSTNWKCDLCGGSSEYGSLACRTCNYDVCSHCTERALGCVRANVSATVGDVLESWRENNDPNANKKKKKRSHAPSVEGLDLFTRAALFAHTTPVCAVLQQQQPLHCAAIGGACACRVTRPHAAGGWAQQPKDSPIFRLLRHFAAFLCEDNAVWRGLIEAVTSYGALVFTHGVLGLPEPLYSVIDCLRRSLPLAFKCELTRFLAVDCRRYALQFIADAGVTLRGTAQGALHSNGLAGKITVPRDNERGALLRLADAFHPSLTLRSKLTFAFEGEEGTGNGPTQELYAEMSSFFTGCKPMWYVTDDQRTIGLPSRTENRETEFFVCGALTGRAFVDGYTMDVSYHPLVWTLLRCSDRDGATVSKEQLLHTSSLWALLSELEPTMANSFKQMLLASASELELMGLEDENEQSIKPENVLDFVVGRIKAHFSTTLMNLQAFLLGLLRSVDLSTLFSLSDEELCVVLGGQDSEEEGAAPLFTEAQLESVVTEAHGYTAGSKEVKLFTSIVGGDFGRKEQRLFLEFLTGSSRLPLNGLQGLGRKITVVKKEMDSKNEATLPSCSTCFLYLKLPPYTSRDIMKQRLLLAVTEGRKNFSLS
ncbi:other hect domain ubiquitin protein ligase E3 [Strigomonas culicis]|uniref:Other hect domain ubiquitin protein ligase E3 n=1 Tax=Strigomonas culicis TaxID=28005 RepID=S9TSF3_9TRYP|nr:other hect domain ubiquitin protein ligase E3 [Strigomonas culicis]|eukprot:EPY19494.1 other hect domain ubiquitin protein ligase E3 [Strigomonas culicis]